jgi:hypothetical protein
MQMETTVLIAATLGIAAVVVVIGAVLLAI